MVKGYGSHTSISFLMAKRTTIAGLVIFSGRKFRVSVRYACVRSCIYVVHFEFTEPQGPHREQAGDLNNNAFLLRNEYSALRMQFLCIALYVDVNIECQCATKITWHSINCSNVQI